MSKWETKCRILEEEVLNQKKEIKILKEDKGEQDKINQFINLLNEKDKRILEQERLIGEELEVEIEK